MGKKPNQAISGHPIFFDPLYKHVAMVGGNGMEFMEYVDELPGSFVDENGDVTFNFYAPNAKRVQVKGVSGTMSGEKVELEPIGDGFFSKTISGIPSGFHYHDYFVDDVMVRNQHGQICYGCFSAKDFIDIPANADDFYLMKEVPHGDVVIEQYHSSINDRMKLCYVYTPPKYDATAEKRYPVLFIQHGVGESESGWIWNGKLNLILDNLIAEGKCKEMIVVMNSGYAFKKDEDPVFYPGDFDGQLIHDCLPFIENKYKTIRNRTGRAIAGLSLGSAQAALSANLHPDIFGSVGVFSGFPDKAVKPIIEEKIKYEYVFLSCGVGEAQLYEALKDCTEKINAEGVRCECHAYPGFHEWSPWRESLRDFAIGLFAELDEKTEDGKIAAFVPEYTGKEHKQWLYQDILFHDNIYKTVIHAFDENGRPAGKYGDLKKGYEIVGEGKVRFNFYGPEGNEVEVSFLGGPKYRLSFEDGIYTGIVEDVEPGFHYFELLINGNPTINQQAPVGYGAFKAMNFFEMPDKDFDAYVLKDVPHGNIHLNYVKSSQTGRTKLCYVYTPAGYETSGKEYPVVYLQHGGGENENGWIWQGKVNNLMDNMLHEKLCEEMIVVMTTGYSFRPDGTSHKSLGSVKDEIALDIVPFIDAKYRTIKNRSKRAIAGLSMGCMQSQMTLYTYPELFANAGLFSGGFDLDGYAGPYDYIFVGCGDQEGFIEPTKANVEDANAKGIAVDFFHMHGYHDWTFWRHCFYEFAQKVFRK